MDLIPDKDNNIIIATYKGLCIYQKSTDDFLQIASDPERVNGLNNNFINSLFLDPGGILWIGTEKGE